jgi:hypothetical protein
MNVEHRRRPSGRVPAPASVCVRPVLRLVRRSRPDADHDPAARCRHLYRDASAHPRGARREAALAAVRMLFDWLITGQVAPSNPASAARSQSCGEDRQDAGAGRRGMAAADRPRARGRHHGADRQPLVPGDRHHGVSGHRRHAEACAIDGGAREPAHHQAPRSASPQDEIERIVM